VVETSQARFWFEVDLLPAEDRNDFLVAISNFGLFDRWLGGAANPIARRRFTASEAQIVQLKLRKFFLGSKEKNIAPYAIFPGSKGKCVGVKFPNGWITIK